MNLVWMNPTRLLAEEAEAPIGFGIFFYVGIVLAVIFGFIALARKGLRVRAETAPTGTLFQRLTTTCAHLAEHVYIFVEKVALSVIGPSGVRYVPFLITIWLFIFTSNVLGLFLPFTPTGNITINFAFSIATMVYVQWEGIRTNGFFGHLIHFAGPRLPLNMIYISVLMFVVEIISESAKVLSLALRLFGNIEGGHLVVQKLDFLVHDWFPVGGLLIPIKLLTAIIQAFVYIMLTSVYLGLVTTHENDADAHAKHEHGDTDSRGHLAVEHAV